MTSKEIFSIVEDIYSLLEKKDVTYKVNRDNLSLYLKAVEGAILKFLEEPNPPADTPKKLRLSKIGVPDRKLWLDWNTPGFDSEGGHSGQTKFKFLIGSLIEPLLFLLARESGHTVSEEQQEVQLEGVDGHIDATIDGRLVDAKSASPSGFKKFKEGTILGSEDTSDEFGYLPQVAAYHEAKGLPKDQPPLFLAFEKSSCELALLEVPPQFLPDASALIRRAKEVITMPSPPEARCYAEKPDGKSGNMKIASPCSWCSHKWKCYPNLTAWNYSNGTRFLSQVVKTPDVEEITDRLKAYSKV